MRRRALWPLIAPALVMLGAGAPGDAPSRPPPDPVTVPVALDVAGRITAQVHVNGQGPFAFMIDTGANRSAVSRALAERLALPILRTEEVHTFTGPVSAPITRIASLRAGQVDGVRDAFLPVLDGAVLAGAEGILGADSLADRRMVMDMRRRTVRVEDAERRLRGGGWRSLPARLRFGNLVIADGKINGVNTYVIIDTGAQTSFVNLALVRALERRPYHVQAQTGTRLVSAGRPQRIENFLFVPEVDIGELEMHNITAYAADVHIFNIWGVTDKPAIVIGMDVWGSVDELAIDYRRGEVHVRL